METQEEKAFTPPRDITKLLSYVMKYPKQFWIQAVGGVIYNTFVVTGPIFIGSTIDAANAVMNGEAPLSVFYLNLAAFVGFTLFFQVARYLKRYYIRMVSNLMRCDIRAVLLEMIFKFPLSQLSREKVGDMMSRMVGDVEQVSEAVRKTITEIWDTVLLMLSYFVACMFYSPKITLLASIPIPIAVLIAESLRKPLYSLSLKARKSASQINVHLQHNVSGVSLLRLFGLESVNGKKFSTLLAQQLKWNVASEALQNGMLPLYTLIASLGIILVIGMGGGLVIGGIWTIGSFMAYLTMFSAMATRTKSVARVMNTWHGAGASWDRIREKMSPPDVKSATGAGITAVENVDAVASGARSEEPQPFLAVRNLSFSYPQSETPCLHDVSFTAEKGQIIAITGPVGSGKSALATVLTGLYPYEGEIRMSQTRSDAPLDPRERVAWMDADQFIFSEDVTFNVTLGRMGGDIDGAIALVKMDEDVKRFEKGMATGLMERGVRVSGGQRQRIALARAWYSNPDLLLLDDPFSAIDVNMEAQIMESMRENLGERTVLLFSHRLLTFPMADKVIMLENGRVSTMGKHEELMRQGGMYRDIYMAQVFLGQ